MRDVKVALRQTGMRIHDVEYVVVDEHYIPEAVLSLLGTAEELGAKVLTICGEDHDDVRLVDQCSKLCALGSGFNIRIDQPRDREGLIGEARGGRLRVGQGVLPLARRVRQVPEYVAFSLEIPYHGPDRHSMLCFALKRSWNFSKSGKGLIDFYGHNVVKDLIGFLFQRS